MEKELKELRIVSEISGKILNALSFALYISREKQRGVRTGSPAHCIYGMVPGDGGAKEEVGGLAQGHGRS